MHREILFFYGIFMNQMGFGSENKNIMTEVVTNNWQNQIL